MRSAGWCRFCVVLVFETVSSFHHSPGDSKSVRRELSDGFYSDIDDTVISAGSAHSCELDESSGGDDSSGFGGKLACWGSDSHGQSSPPDVTAVQISTGTLHSCALLGDETITCWGHPSLSRNPVGEFSQVSERATVQGLMCGPASW